jgi:hypothetical protein
MKLKEFENKTEFRRECEYIATWLTEELFKSKEFMHLSLEEKRKAINDKIQDYVNSRNS